MADDYKPSVWQWVKELVLQGATWVAVKVCQGIIFVVDGVAAGVEVSRKPRRLRLKSQSKLLNVYARTG